MSRVYVLWPLNLTNRLLASIWPKFSLPWLVAAMTSSWPALKGRPTTHALIDMMHHWHSVVVQFECSSWILPRHSTTLIIGKLRRLEIPDTAINWLVPSSTIVNSGEPLMDIFLTGQHYVVGYILDLALVHCCSLSRLMVKLQFCGLKS